MKISKGTTVYPSDLGQYNFHYPKMDDPYTLSMDIDVKVLHWIRYDKLTPVEVISPKNYLPYAVLWIKEPR